MPTKTISIDTEAYERLKSVRRKDESFSQAIKRVIKPRAEVLRLLNEAGRHPLSDRAIDAIEQVVAARRRTPSRGKSGSRESA
jgi:predicted CopG family antitoxin